MRTVAFIALLITAMNTAAQNRKVTATSAVQQVTIFTAGARVERTASVSVPAGRTELNFTGLSNQLDPQSIQLKADAGLTLLSVQATRDFISARRLDTAEQGYNQRIGTIRERIEADNKLLQVYQNEEAMLIKNQAIGGQAGVKTTELKDALDLHRQRLTEVYNKQLELQRRLQDMNIDMERMRLQLNEFSKKRDSVQYMVTALVESRETRPVKFQLLYNVKDAGWYPTYDVRVVDINKPLALLMNANVFQRSGETWKEVELLLSTGNPNDNATPSQLQPWMLGFYDPNFNFRNQAVLPGTVSGRLTSENGTPVLNASVMLKGTNKGTTTDANGFFRISGIPDQARLVISCIGFETKEFAVRPGYYSFQLQTSKANLEEVVVVGYGAARSNDNYNASRELAGKVAGIQVVTVATQYQPTTTVYKIDEKYTLETDGKNTTIGIREFPVAADYEYYTAPKLDPAAFLTAKIADWQQYEFQSGEASLYFEGSFLGKTYLDLGTAGDTLTLSLGKDNGVRVTRKLVKEYTAKKFIGNNRTDSRQYEITIRNTKKAPVRIIVMDQFPVAVTKEISVDDIKAPGAELNKETGLASWDLTIQPGTEKKLVISYEVKYPKDRKVVLE